MNRSACDPGLSGKAETAPALEPDERPRVGRGRSRITYGSCLEVNRECEFITATQVVEVSISG